MWWNKPLFHGGNVICQNGKALAVGAYHTLNDIEIINSVLNLQKIRLERHAFTSGQRQSLDTVSFPTINVNFKLCRPGQIHCRPIEYAFDSAAKQNAEVITSYLWDYLRKSGARGFFICLDGNYVSSTNALLIYYLCYKAYNEIVSGNYEVLVTLREITKKPKFTPTSPDQIAAEILTTSYCPSPESTEQSKTTMESLASKISCENVTVVNEGLVASFMKFCGDHMKFTPRTKKEGGSHEEDHTIDH